MLLLGAAPQVRAQGADLDRARAEHQDAEVAYEKSLFVYPRCGDPKEDFQRAIRSQTERLGVADFTLVAAEGSEAVPSSPFRIERLRLRGRGDSGDLASLLRRISALRHSRVLDFEAVHLQAGTGGNVSLDGTLAMGCWDRDASFMDVGMPPGRTPAEIELSMYRRRSQQLRAATAAAQQLDERMQPRRFVDALYVLADAWGQSAVGVNDLRYTAPALTLQGIVLGASAKDAVERSLGQPRFAVSRLEWSPAGGCQAFTAAARLTASAQDPGEALPRNMFSARDAQLCDGPPPAATSVAKRGSGPLTIHLRNVDVRTVFRALHDVSPADGFIVEPDVAGRVNVDFDGVTVDEALAALRAAGAAFATSGPLRRICKTECGPPTVRPRQHKGEPLAFSVAESDILDILRPFEQVTGLTLHAPRDLKGDLTVYIAEAPWDAVFDGLLSAVDRTYTIDGTDVYIGDRATAVPLAQLGPRVSPGPRRLVEEDPKKIAAADFSLAGIAGSNGTWKAYGHTLGSPKQVFVADKDATLFDATVASVTADRVTLRTKGGNEVVVTLR